MLHIGLLSIHAAAGTAGLVLGPLALAAPKRSRFPSPPRCGLDTFLVRSLLVPALVLDLGPPIRWPRHPAPPTAKARKTHPAPAAVTPLTHPPR